MAKDERVNMTVYFPKETWEIIQERVKITRRSKTEEVIYLVNLGLRYGLEADVRALSQLMKRLPKETEQP